MKSVRWMISYILVASLGLWLAFAVSMKFMAPAHSQGAPSSGELPAEFMKEVEATQVPDASKGTAKTGAEAGKKEQVPPPPDQPVAPPPAAATHEAPPVVPPPPAEPPKGSTPGEAPVGDGATAVSPSPHVEYIPQDNYMYDPTGKRDPFKAYKAVRPLPKASAPKPESLEPLQRWELDRLQIVGILWDVRTPRAMVKDPDGAVYTVTKNSKIGRNEGFVAAIREGEVVVVETKYEEGNPVKEPKVMELKK